MATKQLPVKIVGTTAALAADGHGMGMDSETGATNIIFIQLIPQEPGTTPTEVLGSPVASIRLSLDQLKQLNEDISNNLDTFEKAKAKKDSGGQKTEEK